ncbi:hypothetical protein diail_8179 [Diaporthe ilicicola]|nr:hypothetical protein diail_8179 [Diaporthe ilicicola]
MCIHRHPLGGRNFESFSEDPYLTGKLATAQVRGLQSRGVGATPKHFVANDQETKRFKVNAQIDARALREVYLLPFQMVVRDANPWCMMTAYNKVNGHHCDASKELLTDVARKEWHWDGVFMSDWGGTSSTVASLNAGLDLEMPGPPEKRSADALSQPLDEGQIDLGQVDQMASRILRLLRRTAADGQHKAEYCRDMDDPELNTRSFLRRAAAAGIVMLKNTNNALPLLDQGSLSKIAVVGPNAKRVVAGGGGSSYIKAPYWTSVFDSVKGYYTGQSNVDVVFHEGAKVNRYVPTVSASLACDPDNGQSGACLEWHMGHDLNSEILAHTHVDDLYFMGFGDVPPEIGQLTGYSFRARTALTPHSTGEHTISLASIGPCKMFLDGELILEQSGSFEEKETLFFTYGSGEAIISRRMEGDRTYAVHIDYLSHDRQLQENLLPLLDPMEDKFQGFRFGFEEASRTDLPGEAAKIAQGCDAAIVVVGRDKEWETEGQDIPLFELPGEQVDLIQQVAAACRRTIVVVQAGTPVRLEPWIDQVQAVLYTWYQGQELGNAALDVINGTVNPSGRLPITFSRRLQDCPAHSSFPGEQLQSRYAESLYVGYKWWDLVDTKPHFPIGFGLSYNTFKHTPEGTSTLTLTEDTTLTIKVMVENTGGHEVPSRETVLVFQTQQSPTRLARPLKQICGFGKTALLKPGESESMEITVDFRTFGIYDPERGQWVIDGWSRFDILVGTNALDAEKAWEVMAPAEITWIK